METQLWVSNGGHVACPKHGGMYLATAIEQYPRRRRHVTPLDHWELVPVAELDGTPLRGLLAAERRAAGRAAEATLPEVRQLRHPQGDGVLAVQHVPPRVARSGEALVRAAGVRGRVLGRPAEVAGVQLARRERRPDGAGGPRQRAGHGALRCSAPTTRARNASRARGACRPWRSPRPTTRRPASPWAPRADGPAGGSRSTASATTVTTKTTRPSGTRWANGLGPTDERMAVVQRCVRAVRALPPSHDGSWRYFAKPAVSPLTYARTARRRMDDR